MVLLAPFIGPVALMFGCFVSAIPMPDSAVGAEVAVSAPNGVIMSDTAELAAQTGYPYPSSSTASSGSSWSGSSNGNSDSSYNPGNSGSSGSSAWATTTTASTSTSAAISYSTPSYGSGNSNWGGSGYDNCVQQCVASFGSPAASAPTSTSADTGSSGGGATHTVIVAPTQGVLRYVPFVTNASVGDTIKFVWGANVHTVTKSSALTPCNKTADAPFASGSQNKSFVFEQVINNTDTTFYYCGTPTHCQKGMFGIINPPSTVGGMSVGGMMASMAANDSSIAAMWSYTQSQTSGNSVASSWGNNIDMSSMPAWSYSLIAQNVMWNRLFIANNDDVVTADGSIDLGAAGSSPLMIPQDITVALTNNATATSSSGASPVSTASTYSTSSLTSSPSPASTNSASTLGSPTILIALMAAAATFFAL